MEEILKKIIDIDNNAKKIIDFAEQNESEIDYITREKFEQIEKSYRENEENIINEIVNDIKKEEE